MTPSEWTTTVTVTLNEWFRRIRRKVRDKQLVIHQPFTYPTHIRLAASPTHFIAETCGAREQFDTLLAEPQLEEWPSTSSYFNPGPTSSSDDAPAACTIGEQAITLSGLLLTTAFDQGAFREKIGYDLSAAPHFRTSEGPNAISILPSATGLTLDNMSFVRSDGLRVWFRTVDFAFVTRRDDSPKTFTDSLERLIALFANTHQILYGLRLATVDVFGRELASLADQDVDEPVLDKFIQNHTNHFARALGRKNALPQPRLKWVTRSNNDPLISIPDYVLERGDGSYDILDLKKGLLPNAVLIHGRSARTRFGAYVQELIGQLSGYMRYFSHEENRKYALDTYGIRIHQPRLIGIVGNYDNLKPEDLKVAMENHRQDLTIMSYSDLLNLHRARAAGTV